MTLLYVWTIKAGVFWRLWNCVQLALLFFFFNLDLLTLFLIVCERGRDRQTDGRMDWLQICACKCSVQRPGDGASPWCWTHRWCEPPDVGAGNGTWVPCKSLPNSELLCLLSSPAFTNLKIFVRNVSSFVIMLVLPRTLSHRKGQTIRFV